MLLIIQWIEQKTVLFISVFPSRHVTENERKYWTFAEYADTGRSSLEQSQASISYVLSTRPGSTFPRSPSVFKSSTKPTGSLSPQSEFPNNDGWIWKSVFGRIHLDVYGTVWVNTACRQISSVMFISASNMAAFRSFCLLQSVFLD